MKPLYKLIGTWMIVSCAYALENDKNQTIHFNAGIIEWDQTKHQGHFSKNISIDQGTTHLDAITGFAQGNEKNQFTRIVLLGNEKQQAHFTTVTEANKPKLDAFSDKMVFLPQQKMIKLYGHVYVTQNRYHFHAPYLQYDIDKKKIISQADTPETTTIIIDPDEAS